MEGHPGEGTARRTRSCGRVGGARGSSHVAAANRGWTTRWGGVRRTCFTTRSCVCSDIVATAGEATAIASDGWSAPPELADQETGRALCRCIAVHTTRTHHYPRSLSSIHRPPPPQALRAGGGRLAVQLSRRRRVYAAAWAACDTTLQRGRCDDAAMCRCGDVSHRTACHGRWRRQRSTHVRTRREWAATRCTRRLSVSPTVPGPTTSRSRAARVGI